MRDRIGVMDTVETATAPGTFDVLAFVQQTAYPTREVIVFTDVVAGDEYVRLSSGGVDASKADEHETKLTALEEKLAASSITFTLRGMPPGVVQDILGKYDSDDEKQSLEADNELAAHSIIAVTDAQGNKDTAEWNKEKVADLRKYIQGSEVGKLIAGVVEVNFTARLFDNAVDAGFSGRRTDVA